nr:PREDICTED: uncharacterized protein LOC104041103 [Phalacrocorax carbo]
MVHSLNPCADGSASLGGVAVPQPIADSCNEPCVRQCPDSRVVIYPPPVVVTFPAPKASVAVRAPISVAIQAPKAIEVSTAVWYTIRLAFASTVQHIGEKRSSLPLACRNPAALLFSIIMTCTYCPVMLVCLHRRKMTYFQGQCEDDCYSPCNYGSLYSYRGYDCGSPCGYRGYGGLYGYGGLCGYRGLGLYGDRYGYSGSATGAAIPVKSGGNIPEMKTNPGLASVD